MIYHFVYFIIYWWPCLSAGSILLFSGLLRNWKSSSDAIIKSESILWAYEDRPSPAKCGEYCESFFFLSFSSRLFIYIRVCALFDQLSSMSTVRHYFIHISSRCHKVWHLLVHSIPLKAIIAMIFCSFLHLINNEKKQYSQSVHSFWSLTDLNSVIIGPQRWQRWASEKIVLSKLTN